MKIVFQSLKNMYHLQNWIKNNYDISTSPFFNELHKRGKNEISVSLTDKNSFHAIKLKCIFCLCLIMLMSTLDLFGRK